MFQLYKYRATGSLSSAMAGKIPGKTLIDFIHVSIPRKITVLSEVRSYKNKKVLNHNHMVEAKGQVIVVQYRWI